jgi:hypothetical protein
MSCNRENSIKFCIWDSFQIVPWQFLYWKIFLKKLGQFPNRNPPKFAFENWHNTKKINNSKSTPCSPPEKLKCQPFTPKTIQWSINFLLLSPQRAPRKRIAIHVAMWLLYLWWFFACFCALWLILSSIGNVFFSHSLFIFSFYCSQRQNMRFLFGLWLIVGCTIK